MLERTTRPSSPGETTWSAPSSRARRSLLGVLGGDHDVARGGADVAHGGDRAGGRACRFRSRRPSAGCEPRHHAGRVDRAGGGLDHDRGLVGQGVGDREQLAAVRDEAGGPAAAGRRRSSRSATRARGGRRRSARSGSTRPSRHDRARRVDAAGTAQDSTGIEHHPLSRRRGRPPPRARARRGRRRWARSSATDLPSTVARSEPQMPARRGRTSTHSSDGGSGGSASTSLSGPGPAPLPGTRLPATRAAAIARHVAAELECLHRFDPRRPRSATSRVAAVRPGCWPAG